MNSAMQIIPIFAFMLIPLAIPILAAAFGAVADVLKAPARITARPSAAHRATPQTSRATQTA
ncbi:MAG: hypothetical protein L0H31_00405 [Nocardioidaceae bacterium]|nr:hypothetical protein [Nocardioidaceae bacterium]